MDEITLLRELCFTGVYVTDVSGEIKNTVSEIEEAFYHIYCSQYPPEKEFAFFSTNHQPSLTVDHRLFFWITVPLYTDNELKGYYIVGPNTDHILDDVWMRSSGIREDFIPVLKNLETTSYTSMCRMGEAIFKSINGYPAKIADRHFTVEYNPLPLTVGFNSPNRSYRFEKTLCDGIINHLSNDEINEQLKCLAMERYMKNASLRIYIDHFIGICYLFSHAAIQAGVMENDSFMLCNDFVIQAESCHSIEAVDQLWNPLRNAFTFHAAKNIENLKYSKPVQQLQELIHGNLRNHFRLADLAEELGYNPYYLSSLFHKETGETVQQYTTRIRLDQSLFYLTFSDLAVPEIAGLFCFTDQSDFTRKFKRQFNETPKQFQLRRFREMADEKELLIKKK